MSARRLRCWASSYWRSLDATTVAVIAVPVLMGLATIAGLFLIPQLPLPKRVPFM